MLKERIKSLSGNMNEDKIKKDIEEIETINIELDHRVSKLITENEHLKQTWHRELVMTRIQNSTRYRSKEQYDALIAQINAKSVENSDLNVQLQEKVFAITALKEELRKLKGKSVIACDSVNKPKVITPVVHKVELEPLSPKLKNNRETHVDYIRITKENADTLRDVVEQARTSNPFGFPSKSEKLVAVTPMNKARKVTFAKTNLARARSVKSLKMKEWKPTGKMFKNVGYKWVPTRRTFTIVGTKCPLTRFTSTKIVPRRIPVKSTVITNKKPSSASPWRPKETNHASSSSAPKIVESRNANHLDPNNHMGSNVSISPCFSSVQCRSYKSYLGPVPQRKERCTLQCALSSKEEKSSYSILQAGNPVKEILLKLNLPDHRSILTDLKVTPTKHGRMTKPYSSPRFIANCFNAGYLKMEVKVPGSSSLKRFIATCSYSTDIYKDIMKAKVHVSRLPLL
ncbi:hypothetical protein Tco_0544026 [Tanacetum coccineum]